MKHQELAFQTDDHLRLFAQAWEPDAAPSAVFLLVHGLGEHSGRYVHMADFLTTNGFAVLTFDIRGHGKSEGQRAYCPSFESLMKDIDLLFQEADQRYPGLPRFLYGHSMGGMLVLNYAERRKPNVVGVISSAASLRTSIEKQKAKVALAKILGRIAPRGSLASGLDASAISHDPEVVNQYKNDPLVHDALSFGLGYALMGGIQYAFAHASEIQAPLLVIHGADDQIAYATGSQELAGLVGGDCTLKLWDGMYHEMHNEPDKQRVFDYMFNWMKEKLSATAPGQTPPTVGKFEPT